MQPKRILGCGPVVGTCWLVVLGVLMLPTGCTKVTVEISNETEGKIEYVLFEMKGDGSRQVASGEIGPGSSRTVGFRSEVKDEGAIRLEAAVDGTQLEREDCYLTANLLAQECQFHVLPEAILSQQEMRQAR